MFSYVGGLFGLSFVCSLRLLLFPTLCFFRLSFFARNLPSFFSRGNTRNRTYSEPRHGGNALRANRQRHFHVDHFAVKIFFAFVRISDGFERVGAICEAIWGAIVGAFLFLMNLVMSVNSRKAERRADQYAITLGYGESMVEALYLLEKISLGGEGSAIKRLLASHPRVTARIERLEIALGVEAEEE
jgi:hypothetical protein